MAVGPKMLQRAGRLPSSGERWVVALAKRRVR
jgi:hypothetical protein